jgi:hypothetical protein
MKMKYIYKHTIKKKGRQEAKEGGREESTSQTDVQTDCEFLISSTQRCISIKGV